LAKPMRKSAPPPSVLESELRGSVREPSSQFELRKKVAHHFGNLFLRPEIDRIARARPTCPGDAFLKAEDDAAFGLVSARSRLTGEDFPEQAHEADDEGRGDERCRISKAVHRRLEQMITRAHEEGVGKSRGPDRNYRGIKGAHQHRREDHERKVGRAARARRQALVEREKCRGNGKREHTSDDRDRAGKRRSHERGRQESASNHRRPPLASIKIDWLTARLPIGAFGELPTCFASGAQQYQPLSRLPTSSIAKDVRLARSRAARTFCSVTPWRRQVSRNVSRRK